MKQIAISAKVYVDDLKILKEHSINVSALIRNSIHNRAEELKTKVE